MGIAVGRLVVEVEGFDLPGRSCGPPDAGERYENVHVGVQRRNEVVEMVPGDADAARWSFEITTRSDGAALTDFGGPFVHGGGATASST